MVDTININKKYYIKQKKLKTDIMAEGYRIPFMNGHTHGNYKKY